MARIFALFFMFSQLAVAQDVELTRLGLRFMGALRRQSQLANTPALQSVILRFGSFTPDSGLEGTCQQSNPPVVTINKQSWDMNTDAQREMAVFHELGHCILKRDHRGGVRQGIPVSLMNPVAFSDETYLLNRDYYLEELFSFH